MKKIIIPIVILTLLGCESKPYLDHRLEYEKMKTGCVGRDLGIKMNSNLIGERYVFQECLSVDFTKKDYSVERKGDSVIVDFKRAAEGQPTALYRITLDIDTHPRYNYMSISGNTFGVVPASH